MQMVAVVSSEGRDLERTGRSWPPLHPLVAVYHPFDVFLGKLLVGISVLEVSTTLPSSCTRYSREASLLLERASVHAEIRIPQQLLLHEGT